MGCLIVGFGNIAKIHAKYLSKNNIDWYWYDVNKNAGPKEKYMSIENCKHVDRVIICTPENKHLDSYNEIREHGYDGYILIEKPLGLNDHELTVLDADEKVLTGMVERFNPAVQTLKSHIEKSNLINIDFSRCCVSHKSSPVSILEDIGIHDIDLLFFLLDLEHISDYSIIHANNTSIFTCSDPLVRMIWSKDTFFKERKIIVRQTDCTYEVDLQEQFVLKHWESEGHHVSQSLFVEKSSPINNEHDNFFSSCPQKINCRPAHEVLIDLLKRNIYDNK